MNVPYQRILDAVDNREGWRRKLASPFAVKLSTYHDGYNSSVKPAQPSPHGGGADRVAGSLDRKLEALIAAAEWIVFSGEFINIHIFKTTDITSLFPSQQKLTLLSTILFDLRSCERFLEPMMGTEQNDYHELCYYTLAHGQPSFIHQHVVDAFGVQSWG